MATWKTIVCLANSWKLGAYCVAGVEPQSHEWIRPIGSGSHGAVTAAQQRFCDGTRPELLDLVELPLARSMPQLGQPENWTLAPGLWRKTGHLDADTARKLLEAIVTDEPLFGTNEAFISVADVDAGRVYESLAVVRPEQLNWKKVEKEARFGGGTQIRCRFVQAAVRHNLPVTDPAWLALFVHEKIGAYEPDDSEEVYLVVSLGEPLHEKHYKLVAGVICLPA